jgi:hypothetical protein
MALKHTETDAKPVNFVFGKSNYRWMLISMAIVVIGFLLMTGDTDIYDSRKIVIAPVVVLAGFAVGFYAILKKPDHKA